MGNLLTHTLTLVAALVGAYLISRDATGRLTMNITEQNTALKGAVGDLKTAVNGAMERIESKLDELESKLTAAGEPDPDLQDSIDAIRGETSRLSTFAAAPSTGETGVVTGETSPGGFVEPGTETGTETGTEPGTGEDGGNS